MKLRSWLCGFVAVASVAGCSSATHSPYAGEQEVTDLLGGAGMGYAKAAELDDLFAKGNPSTEAVTAVTARLASAVGLLRASHLNAHTATTRLLVPTQIDRYVEARGYGGAHGHHP